MNAAPDMLTTALKMLAALMLVLGGLAFFFYIAKRVMRKEIGGPANKMIRVLARLRFAKEGSAYATATHAATTTNAPLKGPVLSALQMTLAASIATPVTPQSTAKTTARR